jgi:hypothetical protein
MRKLAIYAAGSLALIAGIGWLFTLAFSTAADRRAIVLSAAIAFVVQLCSFAVTRAFKGTNVIAGWGLGMLFRFAALALYALIGVQLLHLPVAAALVSLVAFFFVSTLLEPVLLS